MARTREFDPDEALEAASKLFWEKGYEATSIDDLVNATGVNRASLYATFGGKPVLFRKVLEHFGDQSALALLRMAGDRTGGIDKIRAVLEGIARETCEEPRGCLLVNASAELAVRDPEMRAAAKRSREQLEAFFAGCLRQARRQGELAPRRNIKALARFLANTVLGLRIVAKSEPERQAVRDIVAVTLSVIEES
jgi:TetR/AcrR family transcriptional regulator, transcriptional repressor for nem operon